MKHTSPSSLLPYLAAIAASIYYFRDLFHRRLPGDIGDGRWTLSVTEHWYQVLRGRDSIREPGFYFPAKHTLGMSDAFLFQGLLHAAVRFLGFGPISAWAAANVGTF